MFQNRHPLSNFSFVAAWIFSLLFLFVSSLVQAQENLFTEVQYSSLNLTAEQETFRQNVDALPHIGALKYVIVGNLPDIQQTGILNFTVPAVPNESYSAEAVSVSYEDDLNYSWSGKIDGSGNGNILITRTPEQTTGFMHLSTRYFSLFPLAGAYSILMEHDPSFITDCSSPTTASASEINYCDEEFNTCPNYIDILALVSPGALAWFQSPTNIKSFQILTEQTTNLALQNSSVPNKVVRVQFVVPTFSVPVTTSIVDDVEAFANNVNAQGLRNVYGADLLVLLTNQHYDNGLTFGRVVDIGVDGSDKAYAIVEAPWLLAPRFTFPHEVAHLLGARHNRPDNGGNDPSLDCAHAFRFTDAGGTVRRTILAGAAINNARILHFSNPDINFNGAATGLHGDKYTAADNARKIRNTGCAVATFRSGWQAMGAIILGPGAMCSSGNNPPFTYNSVVTAAPPGIPGQAPYSYEWRWNASGVFNKNSPGIVISTNSSVQIATPYASPFFFLQLKVTSADNVVLRVIKRVNVINCSSLQPDPGSGDGPGGVTSTSWLTEKNIGVYPNPAEESISIAFDNRVTAPNLVELNNMDGKTVISNVLGENNLSTDGLISLDVHHLVPGIYILKLYFGRHLVSRKVIVH